jgi:hypothetical protein
MAADMGIAMLATQASPTVIIMAARASKKHC